MLTDDCIGIQQQYILTLALSDGEIVSPSEAQIMIAADEIHRGEPN